MLVNVADVCYEATLLRDAQLGNLGAVKEQIRKDNGIKEPVEVQPDYHKPWKLVHAKDVRTYVAAVQMTGVKLPIVVKRCSEVLHEPRMLDLALLVGKGNLHDSDAVQSYFEGLKAGRDVPSLPILGHTESGRVVVGRVNVLQAHRRFGSKVVMCHVEELKDYVSASLSFVHDEQLVDFNDALVDHIVTESNKGKWPSVFVGKHFGKRMLMDKLVAKYEVTTAKMWGHDFSALDTYERCSANMASCDKCRQRGRICPTCAASKIKEMGFDNFPKKQIGICEQFGCHANRGDGSDFCDAHAPCCTDCQVKLNSVELGLGKFQCSNCESHPCHAKMCKVVVASGHRWCGEHSSCMACGMMLPEDQFISTPICAKCWNQNGVRLCPECEDAACVPPQTCSDCHKCGEEGCANSCRDGMSFCEQHCWICAEDRCSINIPKNRIFCDEHQRAICGQDGCTKAEWCPEHGAPLCSYPDCVEPASENDEHRCAKHRGASYLVVHLHDLTKVPDAVLNEMIAQDHSNARTRLKFSGVDIAYLDTVLRQDLLAEAKRRDARLTCPCKEGVISEFGRKKDVAYCTCPRGILQKKVAEAKAHVVAHSRRRKLASLGKAICFAVGLFLGWHVVGPALINTLTSAEYRQR